MIDLNNLNHLKMPSENSEFFLTLFQNDSIKIEAIRSWLKTPGETYNQDQDEWVLLISGEASFLVEDQKLQLKSGDYFLLPKHTEHQVLSTSNDALWLGIFSS